MSKEKKKAKEKLRRVSEGDTMSFAPSDARESIDPIGVGELRRNEMGKRFRAIPSRIAALYREYRANASAHVREGLIGLGFGLCAYLLGSCRFPFDTYPLGMALLCSSPKKILWVFFGLCASALSIPDGGFVWLFAYATAVTVRVLARLLVDPPADGVGHEGSGGLIKRAYLLFTESIYLRMATACASSFMVGLYFLVARGFVFYDLFAAIFSMLVTPAAVFVYSGCFEENKSDARFRQIAIGALGISLTYALRGMSFIGISLGIFFAFFITVYACRRAGLWRGLLLGLLCGLAYAPQYTPIFALAGLVAHLMWSVSSVWAMTAACAVAVMWGIYAEGVISVSRILPAMMLSAAAYVGAQKLSFFPAAKDLIFSGRYCSDMNDADISLISKKEGDKRLTELADTFETLSEIFYNLSDRLCRPGIPELRRMCDGVYDKYCPACPSRQICWELEYSESADIISSLGNILSERGVADLSDLPEYMQSRCAALPGIISEINRQSGELSRISGVADKSRVFAMDYAAISTILSDAARRGKDDMVPHRQLGERLTEVLAKYGFGEGGVSVYGQRCKRIIARGFDLSGVGRSAGELRESVEKACGFKVSEPVIELCEGVMTLRMNEARSLSARCILRVNNTGREECGDTVASFEAAEDRYYVLISDGMGRGREAAFTSGVCSMFLQKMLGCGNMPETVIKMLGGFVRSKPGECSATVDLLSVDLLNGKTEFYKCGAAASFVRRGGNLFKLAANTVPLGILTAGDVGKLTFDVLPGDIVIMLSDGVAGGNDDSVWLLDLLGGGFDPNLEVMAEKIINAARSRGSEDDISVALVQIEPAT